MICANVVCMHVQRINRRLVSKMFQIVGNVGHVCMHMHTRYALVFTQTNK